MQMTKKVVSVVLAVMMVVSMMVVGTVFSASAATITVTTAAEFDAAIQTSGEVVLGANINMADVSKSYATVPTGADVTIDFADYTLTAYYGIENDGTLTLKASGTGGINATCMAIDNFGKLTVESGTYTSSQKSYATIHSEDVCTTLVKGGTFTNDKGYGVYIYKNSNTTINGGTFTAEGWVVCSWAQTTGAKVTITNGTFTSTGNAVLSGNGKAGAGGNTWTIKGGTFNANADIADTEGYLSCAIYAPNDDTWTISGGTFNVKDGVAVCQRAGTVKITGGTFNVTGDGTTGKVGDSRVVVPSGSAVVYDSKANYPAQSDEDATAITGGTFNTDQEPIAMVKADDSDPDRVTVTGGTFSGDASDYVDYTDIIWEYTNNAGKTQYLKANPSAYNSGTYKLMKDVTTTSYITPGVFGSDVTVDLNGHTYTSSASKYAVLASRNGDYKMTIKNGTINYTNDSSKFAAVQYQGKGNNLTLENVTINSAVAGIAMLSENQNLVVDGCTINATDDFALVTNGSSTKNGTITVTDSKLTSNGSVGVYLPGDADVTFTDTDVTGTTAVYIKGGNVEFNGGTYTANGVAADYVYNGNGCNSTGDAIVIENAGSAYPGADVIIKDGTFTSANGKSVSTPVKEDSLPAAEGFVSGGNFSNEVPAEQCATGFEPAPFDPATNMYTVQVKVNPLDDATGINAAQAATQDGNQFELPGDINYLVGQLLGVQEKAKASVGAPKTSESGQETDNDIRFIAVLDSSTLRAADDYGFVLAKVNKDTNRKYSNTKFENLKANFGNGEKTISAKGTFNNVCGDEAYGNPNADTAYKYITCAVNGVSDNEYVVARFYVTLGGKTYYAKYAGHGGNYTGCMTGFPVIAIED